MNNHTELVSGGGLLKRTAPPLKQTLPAASSKDEKSLASSVGNLVTKAYGELAQTRFRGKVGASGQGGAKEFTRSSFVWIYLPESCAGEVTDGR